jgi:hypothetical protein
METTAELKDVELRDSFGETQRLGELWRDQPVAIVWLRHYG